VIVLPRPNLGAKPLVGLSIRKVSKKVSSPGFIKLRLVNVHYCCLASSEELISTGASSVTVI